MTQPSDRQPPRRPRLLVAAEQPLVIEGLRAILDPRYELLTIEQRGVELLALIGRREADVLFLDLGSSPASIPDLVRSCRERSPNTAVIVTAASSPPSLVESVLEAGAAAFVPRSAPVEDVRAAFEEELARRGYRSSDPAPAQLPIDGAESSDPALRLLTPTQLRVVRLAGRGLTTAQMAAAIGVSSRTVQGHRTSIRRRLGLRNEFEFVQFAVLAARDQEGKPHSRRRWGRAPRVE